ncbi:unnamed protein product [Phytophthora fragariaefolia]|uniref:Unnamed protein product n=1 Tax=Phytophthora fragariaefolia TaxID=1490495 RepID=A0A9W6XL32_9STRA|nr:unnamed protein product [Phytophthora fragariaefolia]
MSKKLRQGYSTIHLHLNAHGEGKISEMVVKAMRRVLGSTGGSIINSIATQTDKTYVLMYGDRTNGKTGAAECGAIVLSIGKQHADTKACWIGHMSYAGAKMTNQNTANLGLLTGLMECARKRYTLLHTIGDNKTLVMQHKHRKAPKATHLKSIFWRCRRLTNNVAIQEWHHHPRSHTRMVETLANLVIDSGKKQAGDTRWTPDNPSAMGYSNTTHG